MNSNILVLLSAIIVVVIDSVYLNLVKGFFARQIADVQKSPMKINMTATILVYVFMIFGLNYFIIRRHASVSDAFLLGLVIYGVFEFTNMALFDNWRITTVLLDATWGGILFALTTFLTYKIGNIIA